MSKYGDFSGSYFPVLGPNTGKYGPEKTPYMDTFHAVFVHDIRKVTRFLVCVASIDMIFAWYQKNKGPPEK